MFFLKYTLLAELYYNYKVPYWYNKHVSYNPIPKKLLAEIKQEIRINKLTKEEIKKYLSTIQRKNSRENKKLWDKYLEEHLPKQYIDLELSLEKESDITAVIVEARKHLHFKVVVQNIMNNLQHLKPCLNIYHGTENEEYVKNELKQYQNINFINLNVSNLDIEAYNKIMLSKEFWERIPSSKVLIFQTDAITFKPLDLNFLKYDYIGAPWKKHIRKKNKVDVGNGGLSLRSRDMMISIIEKNIPRNSNIPEDIYLCQIIKKQKYKLANFDTALEFSTENIFNKNAFGCHKIWEETTIEQLKMLLK
jgi:hypothetical protein